MILADYHTHTMFSSDSDASPEAMIEQAKNIGLSYLCFTDHYDLDYPGSTAGHPLFVFSMEEYLRRLLPLREKSLKHGLPLQVRIGIELGLRPNRPDIHASLSELLLHAPLDFVLGSIHLVDDKDPYYAEFWHAETKKNALSRYFDTVLSCLCSFSNFDALGHLDYVIRYLPDTLGSKDYFYRDYCEVLDEILRQLIQKEIALEINTKGLSCIDSLHPSFEVLDRYKELGGRLLTIGSDAHHPSVIASDYKKTRELLLSHGFTTYCVFTDRKPELFRL